MPTLDLSAGPVEYRDTGGDGDVYVLLPGLLMDSTLWDAVADDLAAGGARCVVPTLPLGAHRVAMRPDADLSLPGIARLVSELLDTLDLHDVTLVGNDTGGAITQLVMTCGDTSRLAGAALVSCEAFDNLPPGLTGRTIVALGHLPPRLFGAALQQLRLRPFRRMPFSFGWLTKRGDTTVRAWLTPALKDNAIRRDATKALRALHRDRHVLTDAATKLSSFTKPTLIIWAQDDRVMPPEHADRLATFLPDARVIKIPDTYTLIPLDQPAALAAALRGRRGSPVGRA